MGYGITLDFLNFFFILQILLCIVILFSSDDNPFLYSHKSHNRVLNSTLCKLKYSQMYITYQSSHQATQSYGIIFNICTGESKLSGMTSDSLVLPISWQRGKERNCQKGKKMESMNEIQKGLNSHI